MGKNKVIVVFVFLLILTGCEQLNSIDCPQLNIPLYQASGQNSRVIDRVIHMNDGIYDGWTIDGNNYADIIQCRSGAFEGENPNYIYCESRSSLSGVVVSHMTKTLMNSDGTIGKTIDKTFTNVYEVDKENNNVQFIKTICGDSVDVEAKRGRDETLAELDKWLG